jgi:hypothetical protein
MVKMYTEHEIHTLSRCAASEYFSSRNCVLLTNLTLYREIIYDFLEYGVNSVVSFTRKFLRLCAIG